MPLGYSEADPRGTSGSVNTVSEILDPLPQLDPGLVTRPMNRMLPQRFSRRMKRNGRSTSKGTGVSRRRRRRHTPTAVAALASVPCSSTLMIATCWTKSTNMLPLPMPDKSAEGVKTSVMPMAWR